MSDLNVTITLESAEYQALESDYKRKGLGRPTSGYVAAPIDNVLKKLVEAVRAGSHAPLATGVSTGEHVRRFGPGGREA